MRYRLALYLDEARLARLRGSPLEGLARPMFGGGLYVLVVEVGEGLGLEVLQRFPSASVDARGFVEDVPVSFRRVLLRSWRPGGAWRRSGGGSWSGCGAAGRRSLCRPRRTWTCCWWGLLLVCFLGLLSWLFPALTWIW